MCSSNLLVLLAVCLWPRVVRRAAALGEGALVLVALAPAIALCAEPRGILNLFPMLAVLAAAELPDLSRPRARLFDAVFIASALAASKLWLPLDVGPFTSHPLDWPDQRLFLSSGPWMLASTYWPQAAAAVVLLGVFAWLVHSPTWPSGRGAA